MATLLDPTSNEQKFSKLMSAAIVGATTTDSTRLWVRVYEAGKWSLVVTTMPLTGDLVRLEEKSVTDFLAGQNIAPVFFGTRDITQDSNLTCVFDVAGLAADTRYYPLGTVIYIPGYGYGVVEDRGGDIKGRHRLDLFYNTHKEARNWGRKKLETVVFPKGTPVMPKNAPPPR